MTTQLRPVRGRHPAVCRNIQIARGEKSDQVVIGFELIDPSPDAGSNLSYFGSLSDAAIVHTIKALRNVGWTGDNLADLPGLAESDMLAEVVDLVVDHEEYDGKWRVKIKWVNRPGDGGKIKLDNALTGTDLDAFGAAMRGRVAAAARATTGGKTGDRHTARPPEARRQSFPRTDVPPPGDGDIPF